jgi:uncharacterized protein (TIGR02118 family)
VIRRIPEIRRYVASITLPGAYRNREPLFDGISEVWFDDEDVLRKTADTPPRKAASADDAKFVDISKYAAIVTDEIVQIDGAAKGRDAVKVLSFLTRKPGMSVADFQKYWRTYHGPLAAKLPQARRYAQCHVRPSGYADGKSPLFDGVAEMWFDNLQAMRDSNDTPEYREVRLDEPKFLATPFRFIIAAEHAII